MSTAAAPAPIAAPLFHPLLTWKDPVKTGKVFGAIVAALILLKSVNLLNLYFHVVSLTLITSAVAEYAGKLLTGTGLVTRFRPAYSQIVSTKGAKLLQSIGQHLPQFEIIVQKVVYSANIEETLKVGVLFYILFKITSWVSIYTLIVTGTLLGFSVPAVYESYQKEIDAAIKEYSAVACEKASEYSKVAQEKAAPYIKQVDEKLGPVSKFIKQKYQVRTGGSTVAQHPFESTQASTTSATTSGANASPSNDFSFSGPAASTTEFPSVPDTKPEATTPQNVDLDDLKSDILKNKAAAATF